MLEEIMKKYRKQAIKVAIRLVYYKYNGCNVYSIYYHYGRICYSK